MLHFFLRGHFINADPAEKGGYVLQYFFHHFEVARQPVENAKGHFHTLSPV